MNWTTKEQAEAAAQQRQAAITDAVAPSPAADLPDDEGVAAARERLFRWLDDNNPGGHDFSKPPPRELLVAAFPDEDEERVECLLRKPNRIYEIGAYDRPAAPSPSPAPPRHLDGPEIRRPRPTP